MPPTQTPPRTCPACSTPYSPTARICSKCKLEVAQMPAFAAAKQAAAKRGLQRTTIISAPGNPLYRQLLRPIILIPALLAVILIWYFTRPAPPPAWSRFPATPQAAAQSFLTDLYADNNKANDLAYALIDPAAPTSHIPDDTDDRGHYYQLFTTIDHYLAAEFGNDWLSRLTLNPDPADPATIDAHIGPETLHIRTSLQTPPALLTDANHHYAILAVNEFDINDAAKLQQSGAVIGILRGTAGQGAVNNLETIIAAGGSPRHETPMQRKLRILPNLRDPRNAVRRTVLQAWPIRTDPVIRARLTQITTDGRYPPDVQQTATQILQGTVPEEDLAAAGVE